MSEDERDEALSEEPDAGEEPCCTPAQDVPAEEPQEQETAMDTKPEETAPAKPDIVDEDELDIEISRVAPRKSGGRGLLWAILVVVLVGVGIGVAKWWEGYSLQLATEAREARDEAYSQTQKTIEANLKDAAEQAAEGKVVEALDALQTATNKWESMATSALGAGDTDQAQYAKNEQSKLRSAIEELDKHRDEATEYAKRAKKLREEARELQDKRDELNALVSDRIFDVATAKGGVAPETPKATDKAAGEKATAAKKEATKAKPEAQEGAVKSVKPKKAARSSETPKPAQTEKSAGSARAAS